MVPKLKVEDLSNADVLLSDIEKIWKDGKVELAISQLKNAISEVTTEDDKLKFTSKLISTPLHSS